MIDIGFMINNMLMLRLFFSLCQMWHNEKSYYINVLLLSITEFYNYTGIAIEYLWIKWRISKPVLYRVYWSYNVQWHKLSFA